ncbi:hypothetical protein HDV02_002204 [Globomyces sp. JEL0801]|nr:hypothetical protein HDV02_002204 [Globomyces sp. JEL0801]
MINLPIEIQIMIASHLHILDYHNLRKVSKSIRIPFTPRLTFQSYKQSTLLMSTLFQRNKKRYSEYLIDISKYMEINHTLKQSQIQFIFENEHYCQFNRMFKNQWNELDQSFKQDLFESCIDGINNGLSNFKQQVLELMLKDETMQVSMNDNIALFTCIENHNEGLIESIIHHNQFNVDTDTHESLILVLESNLKSTIKLLFNDTRLDPSLTFGNCLEVACITNHYDIVIKLLVDARLQEFPSSYFNHALEMACCYPIDSRIIRVLLVNTRIDVNANGNQALLNACQFKLLEHIDLILSTAGLILTRDFFVNLFDSQLDDMIAVLVDHPRFGSCFSLVDLLKLAQERKQSQFLYLMGRLEE